MINDRVVTKSPMKHWHEILEEWVSQVRKISRITDKMSRSTGEEFTPYAYREQTNVGVLASAATRAGWAALQERRVEKQANDGIRDNYLGRADLLLCNGTIIDQIEAKLTRCSLSSPALKRVVSKHNKAIVDSKKLSSNSTKK